MSRDGGNSTVLRTHHDMTWQQALRVSVAVWVSVAGTGLQVCIRKTDARDLMAIMECKYEPGWWKLYDDNLHINAYGVRRVWGDDE